MELPGSRRLKNLRKFFTIREQISNPHIVEIT